MQGLHPAEWGGEGRIRWGHVERGKQHVCVCVCERERERERERESKFVIVFVCVEGNGGKKSNHHSRWAWR